MRKILLLLAVFILSSFTEVERYKIFYRFPINANCKVIETGGRSYKACWSLWGPDSIEEKAAEFRMTPDLIRREIRSECSYSKIWW
jgi:hypothetical protein